MIGAAESMSVAFLVGTMASAGMSGVDDVASAGSPRRTEGVMSGVDDVVSAGSPRRTEGIAWTAFGGGIGPGKKASFADNGAPAGDARLAAV